jgi:hypothetical protein
VAKNFDTGVFSLDLPQLDPFMEMAEKRLAENDEQMTEALKADLFGHNR